VRNNTGGLPQNVYYIANRFADATRVFATIRTKDGPGPEDFSDPVDHEIFPEGMNRFAGPIILLTNSQTISGGEWFTMAMKTLPNVVQMGTATAGALSLSLWRELPNGWIYRVSVELITDVEGVCPEGVGLQPVSTDVVENSDALIEAGVDSQLDAAIARLTILVGE